MTTQSPTPIPIPALLPFKVFKVEPKSAETARTIVSLVDGSPLCENKKLLSSWDACIDEVNIRFNFFAAKEVLDIDSYLSFKYVYGYSIIATGEEGREIALGCKDMSEKQLKVIFDILSKKGVVTEVCYTETKQPVKLGSQAPLSYVHNKETKKVELTFPNNSILVLPEETVEVIQKRKTKLPGDLGLNSQGFLSYSGNIIHVSKYKSSREAIPLSLEHIKEVLDFLETTQSKYKDILNPQSASSLKPYLPAELLAWIKSLK